MKTRSPWTWESPFVLITRLELGDRVMDQYRGQEAFGWAGRLNAYHGQPILRRLAEHDWRGWWRDTQARKEET